MAFRRPVTTFCTEAAYDAVNDAFQEEHRLGEAPEPPGLPERLRRWVVSRRGAILCLLGLWLAFIVGQLTPCFDMNPDSARYLGLARSISGGRGYTLEGRFFRSYPPLFPLMLSTVASAERHDFRPEKLIVALTGLGALLASYWLLSQRHDARTAAFLALLVAVSPSFLRYCIRIRADVPFLFFVAIFAGATDYFWRARKISWPAGLASGAALALATLTRLAGLVFYLTAFAWLARPSLWRRDARRCVVFGICMMFLAVPPAVGWSAWVHSRREDGTASYGEGVRARTMQGEPPLSVRGLRLLAAKEARTVPVQVANAAKTVVRIGGSTCSPFWAALLLPVGLLGLLRRLRAPAASDYAFCGYGLMILFWPMPQGARLWLPVLPLMLGYLADGVAGLGHFADEFPALGRWEWVKRSDRLLGRWRAKVAWWGTASLLAIGLVTGTGMIWQSWLKCRDAVGGVGLSTAPLDVARFLSAGHTRPVVLSYSRFREVAPAISDPKVRLVGLPLSAGDDGEAVLRELRRSGVTHLAIEREISGAQDRVRVLKAARELAAADPGRLRLVAETEHVQVFELPPPEPP